MFGPLNSAYAFWLTIDIRETTVLNSLLFNCCSVDRKHSSDFKLHTDKRLVLGQPMFLNRHFSLNHFLELVPLFADPIARG